ncbi:MAG: GAF domain-containing protein [Chloroflexi bacterium]|nr:GAF domain-containing protein [Chloroflexota bacterium]
MQQVVADLGHVTCGAGDGAHALALYDASGADVVVSDWMMPGLDGVQLCREVRSRIGAPYTYFILLTALGDTEHKLAGVQAGVDDFVAKPFNIDDLEARLIAAERVTVVHRRQEALLRMTRQFAAEADPARLVDELLNEAIQLVGGAAGVVTCWDEDSRRLVPVASTAPIRGALRLRLGEGASGRAAQSRQPVLTHSDDDQLDPILKRAHMNSAVAVPLMHQGRLVGTLAVGNDAAHAHESAFTSADAELLDMLASTAAAALVALEHARLDGVLLAARTAQHELNNQLAVARGFAEMLIGSPDLPPHLRDIAAEVIGAADNAAAIVRQLRDVSTIHEQRWNAHGDTTINLVRSQAQRDGA